MFHKPFRVKSNTSIKGSDRKKLRSEIEKLYPDISSEELREVIPNKEEMTVMKIYTHSGLNVLVYFLSKNPVFFDLDSTVYPTVYTLWKYPGLIPVFTTWPPVFTKIIAGADLMLPGLIVKDELSPAALGNLRKGHPCAVKLLGNKAPVAVGKTALSSSDMFDSAMRGKGVLILHCYQDQLWAHGDKSVPPVIVDLEMSETSVEKSNKVFAEEDEERIDSEFQEAGARSSNVESTRSEIPSNISNCDNATMCQNSTDMSKDVDRLTLLCDNGSGCEDATVDASASGGLPEEELSAEAEKEKMDALLYQCFLHSLKTSLKPKTDLPLLTSKFYKSHLQVCCPPGESLDVKKSSYKKLTKFLGAMQKQEFIKVKELSKGVESIVEVYRDHQDVRGFVPPDRPDEALLGFPAEPSDPEKRGIVQITDLYMVSAATSPVFRQHRKGTALTAQAVRQALEEYVESEELQDPKRKGYVILGPVLSDVAVNRGEYIEILRMDDLTTRVINKMNPAHQIHLPGQRPTIRKGRIEPVVISVAQRGGNKKVTLVHNLETYGIEPQTLAHDVQIGVACSTSVCPIPGKNKGQEVLVQGNQINFIASLLQDKYGVHRKYMLGLEKAPKAAKKKR